MVNWLVTNILKDSVFTSQYKYWFIWSPANINAIYMLSYGSVYVPEQWLIDM